MQQQLGFHLAIVAQPHLRGCKIGIQSAQGSQRFPAQVALHLAAVQEMPQAASAITRAALAFGMSAGQAQDPLERIVAPVFQQRLQALGQIEILQQDQPRATTLRARRCRAGQRDHQTVFLEQHRTLP